MNTLLMQKNYYTKQLILTKFKGVSHVFSLEMEITEFPCSMILAGPKAQNLCQCTLTRESYAYSELGYIIRHIGLHLSGVIQTNLFTNQS